MCNCTCDLCCHECQYINDDERSDYTDDESSDYTDKLINALECIIEYKNKDILFLNQNKELKDSQEKVIVLCDQLNAANQTIEAYLTEIERLRGKLLAFEEPELLDNDLPLSKEEYRNLMLSKQAAKDVKIN